MDAVIGNMRSTFGSGVRKMFSNNNQTGKNNTASDTQISKMSLKSICQNEGSTVPFIVRDICKFISEKSMKVEGIFRVNASQRLLNELRELYESNTNYEADLLLNQDDTRDITAHAAAGLLKKFMRQLSEPLIHADVLQIFLESKSISDQDFCTKVKSCMEEWPAAHRDTLLHLLTFLHAVAQESKNRMSVNSLAVVFGPNVFKLPEGPEALQAQNIANQTFERLLSCSYLLTDRPLTPSVQAPPRPPPPVFRPLPTPPNQKSTPTVTKSPLMEDNSTVITKTEKPVPAVRKLKLNKQTKIDDPLYQEINVGTTENEINGHLGDTFNVTSNSDILNIPSSSFTPVPVDCDSKSTKDYGLSPRSKSSGSSEIPELVFEESEENENSQMDSGELKFADDSSAILEDSIRAVVRTRLFNSTESSSVSDDAEKASFLSSMTAGRNKGPKNRRKPTRTNNLLHNVHFDNSDDETILTPSNSDITTARSTAMDSVVTVLTPTATDQPSTLEPEMSPVAPVTVVNSVTTVTTPDSGCVVDDFTRNSSPMKSDMNETVNSSPVHVPKLNLRSSFDEDDFPKEVRSPSPAYDEVPQLDLSSVTESANREEAKIQRRALRADNSSSPPKSGSRKPHPKKKKKKQIQVKKQSKSSPENNVQLSDCEIIEAPEETMEQVRDRVAEVLRDNRRIAGRPYDITKMITEELKEEKLSMQRELLKYESRYGRPSTKEEKQMMREIYDRYRSVKRLLLARGKEETDENENTLKNDASFLVTQQLGNEITSCDESDATQQRTPNTPSADLLSQLQELRGKRKRLRRILRDFENRREIENLERRIMRSEYEEYKAIKTKVRELEVALAKSGHLEVF